MSRLLGIFFCLFCFTALGISSSLKNADGFTLIDEVCLIIEGEPPILRSQINLRAKQDNISFAKAQIDLAGKALLWADVRKQQKYNIADIFKKTDEHIKHVIDSNRLTKEKFSELSIVLPILPAFHSID